MNDKAYIYFPDAIIKWKHFPRNWSFVRGIHRSPVNSTHKGQWRGALMFSLICVGINDWVNNREAGDLKRYRAHYDVIVMLPWMPGNTNTSACTLGCNRTWLWCISGVLSTKVPSRSNELTDWNGKLNYIKLHQIGVGLVTVMPGDMSVSCCKRMHMKTCLHNCANSQ